MKIRIGTRGSDLALWQANFVAGELRSAGCEVEIQVLKTRGDLIDDVPLQNVEGKAFFTAEIEQALHAKRVDVAVHSHKDLPVESPPGLMIAAVPVRAAQAERLLLNPSMQDQGAAFLPLKPGARVGTSSPRRRAQIEALRPDLEVLDLRGNVPTRVNRLREGRYDAILLAAAGLNRLELDTSDLVTLDLPLELFVPAPAQGALAIQTRVDDLEVSELCKRVFHHAPTSDAIVAERTLLTLAGGGCNLALGAALQRHGDAWQATVFRGPDATDPEREARWASACHGDAAQAASLALEGAQASHASAAGPLAGLRVEVLGTRTAGSRVGKRLAQLGACVQHTAVIRCEPVAHRDLAVRFANLKQGDALALSSAHAVPAIEGLKLPEGVLVAAVGPATADALEQIGVSADWVGSMGALEMGKSLPLEAEARVLFPCAQDALPALGEALQQREITLDRVEVYSTHPISPINLCADSDLRIYMSPSAVRACVEYEQAASSVQRVALGPSTASEMQFHPWSIDWFAAGESSSDPIEALVRYLAGKPVPRAINN